MIIALIVAAGRGERLGAGRPKAFVEVAGRPLFQWSVDALSGVDGMERIVLALPPGTRAPAGRDRGGRRSGALGLRAQGAGRGRAGRRRRRRGRPRRGPAAASRRSSIERVLAVLAGDQSLDAAIAAAAVVDTVKRVQAAVGRRAEARRRRMVGTPTGPTRRRRERDARPHRAVGGADAPDLPPRGARTGAGRARRRCSRRRPTTPGWWSASAGGWRSSPAGAENLKVTTALDLALAELLLDQPRAGIDEPAPAPWPA